MMKSILLTFLFTVSVYALSLAQTQEIAKQHSPVLSQALSQVKSQHYYYKKSTSSYLPTIDAGFTKQYLENKGGFVYSPTYNYNLSAKYNIFNGFSDQANVSSANHLKEVAKLEYESTYEDVKLSVIIAYVNHLKAQKYVGVQEEQLASLNQEYENAQIRYEQGMIAKNELLMIDVERLKAVDALYKAKSHLKITHANLENVIGVQIDSSETFKEVDTTFSSTDEIDSLEKQMIENRSELKALKHTKLSLSDDKEAIRGNFYPHLDAEVAYTKFDQERRSGDTLIQPSDQTSLLVNLSWNLFSGGRDYYQQKALQEKVTQVNYQTQALKLDMRNQLTSAYQTLNMAEHTKTIAQRAKESAAENYRISTDKYTYGEIGTLELLVSQSNLTLAINAYNNAYYETYIAYRTIQRIIQND